jgi:hypothetical protein
MRFAAMVTVRARPMVEDVRRSDSPSDDDNSRDGRRGFRGCSAARDRGDRAFAQAPRSHRGAVAQQTSERAPESRIQAR